MNKTLYRVLRWVPSVILLGLSACANQQPKPDHTLATTSAAPNTEPKTAWGNYPPLQWHGAAKARASLLGWQSHTFASKRATQYTAVEVDGRQALMAWAQSSVSMVRQSVRVEPSELGDIRFSWKVPALIPGADLLQRDAHDSPVRVLLVFEGNRSGFSVKNALLSELSKTLTGEDLPYATLMYVWCNTCLAETVFVSPRTDRIREVAVQAGTDGLNRWLDYTRNVRADYEKVFGEAPGALLGVGIMTDTDNTRQNVLAWYGAVSLTTPAVK